MRCRAFVLGDWIVHDLFCIVEVDPTGNEGRWLGGWGSLVRSVLHLSNFSGAVGVAVSGGRVFLLREICQGLRLCAGGLSLHVACLRLSLRVCVDVCLTVMSVSVEE